MTATHAPGLPVIEDGQLISTNPATGAEAGRVPAADEKAVIAAVDRAREAAVWWQSLGWEGRRTRLLRWRTLLVERIEELAELTRLETGKPLNDGIIEITAAVEHLDWAARHAKRVL